MKREEKTFLFHQGRSWNFDGTEEIDKREHKILRGPNNGVRLKKCLKVVFEYISKIDYIALVSGDLKENWVQSKSKIVKNHGIISKNI